MHPVTVDRHVHSTVCWEDTREQGEQAAITEPLFLGVLTLPLPSCRFFILVSLEPSLTSNFDLKTYFVHDTSAHM